MKYQYLFGPVNSRRLGRSLGVDMVLPKTCTLDCIYCECGATNMLTLERREYVLASAIIAELDHFLSESPLLDHVTFGGSGEPTLNSKLEEVICFVKTVYPAYKRALLTNGTLFSDPAVRRAAAHCTVVLPSIDAVTPHAFAQVNRPHATLDIDVMVGGIAQFVKEFDGQVWVEVFIVAGINDTPEEVQKLKRVLQAINPSLVQLNSLDRPGVCDWVKPASASSLCLVAEALAPLPVEVVARMRNEELPGQLSQSLDKEVVLAMLRRRPSSIEDIALALQVPTSRVHLVLTALEDEGVVRCRDVGPRGCYTVV